MPSGMIRSMASTDARLDEGGGVGAVAVGADIREPLRSLYQNSPHDPGVAEHVKTFPVPSKLLQPVHRPFLSGSPKSSSSRIPSPDAEDASHLSEGGGGGGGVVAREPGTEQRLRMSSNPRGSHTTAPEEHHEATPRAASECSEIQNVDDTASSPMCLSEGSQSYCGYSDSQLITDVEDNENLMQLKLEAMTWAAMAKDFTISSLEKRLRKALQIAKAEHAKNLELQTALDQSREELLKAREDIVKLEEAEELLARERGEVEVDATNFAADQARHHRSQLLLLEHRIRLMLGDKAARGQQDRYLEMSPNSQGTWQESDVGLLEQELEKSQKRERALTDKFSEAQQEIEELKGELNDTRTDLRVSEVLRKAQSRRLKVLEKERRYLLRKGALRTVKLAPRTQRRVEPSMPGGPSGSGWNVFSVLEYAETEV